VSLAVSPLIKFLCQRLVIGLLTIWAISILSFVIIQLPPGDFVSNYVAQLKHLILPMALLGLAPMTRLFRIFRANLLDEIGKPYVVTARAKGMREFQLILKCPTRIALNPVVSTIGFALPQLISGSLIISLVMSLPTLGPVLLRALQAQDMFLAGAIMLVLATLTVAGVLISDLLLAWLDPRIRLQS
jgi:peptide/nickel transport system permease protein